MISTESWYLETVPLYIVVDYGGCIHFLTFFEKKPYLDKVYFPLLLSTTTNISWRLYYLPPYHAGQNFKP